MNRVHDHSLRLRTMQPRKLALVDDDQQYTEGLAHHLRTQGFVVDEYFDSNDLLAHADPFIYDFYVTDLMLPGVDGVDLIKVLRQRTNAGVLVVSGRLAAETFKEVLTAGADMYLSKPVDFEQVVVAIEAIGRRAAASHPTQSIWRLDRRIGQLIAPDGTRIDLSATDRQILECFLKANGDVVPRETLLKCLGRIESAEVGGGLNGTIFRLRRRIERATTTTVPLQAKSGVGYVFRAPLTAI